jgi:CRP-like cAMP-binding protein
MEDQLFEFISTYITLTSAEKNAITELDLFRHYKKGTYLLQEGQYTNESFFVIKGCIRCFYVIDGEEKTTAFYTEMQGIEPSCVVDKKPSAYYLVCVEDAILSVSNKAMETEIFENFPRFEAMCRAFSAQEIVQKQQSFDEFKLSSPEERYLNLLKNRAELLQRVPQHQIASYLGIKPQSLSRMRARIMSKNH